MEGCTFVIVLNVPGEECADEDHMWKGGERSVQSRIEWKCELPMESGKGQQGPMVEKLRFRG